MRSRVSRLFHHKCFEIKDKRKGSEFSFPVPAEGIRVENYEDACTSCRDKAYTCGDCYYPAPRKGSRSRALDYTVVNKLVQKMKLLDHSIRRAPIIPRGYIDISAVPLHSVHDK